MSFSPRCTLFSLVSLGLLGTVGCASTVRGPVDANTCYQAVKEKELGGLKTTTYAEESEFCYDANAAISAASQLSDETGVASQVGRQAFLDYYNAQIEENKKLIDDLLATRYDLSINDFLPSWEEQEILNENGETIATNMIRVRNSKLDDPARYANSIYIQLLQVNLNAALANGQAEEFIDSAIAEAQAKKPINCNFDNGGYWVCRSNSSQTANAAATTGGNASVNDGAGAVGVAVGGSGDETSTRTPRRLTPQ